MLLLLSWMIFSASNEPHSHDVEHDTRASRAFVASHRKQTSQVPSSSRGQLTFQPRERENSTTEEWAPRINTARNACHQSVDYNFFPLRFPILVLLFLSLLVVAQTRGHKARSSPPFPLRFVPRIFIARRLQPFLTRRICINDTTFRKRSKGKTNSGVWDFWKMSRRTIYFLNT